MKNVIQSREQAYEDTLTQIKQKVNKDLDSFYEKLDEDFSYR